MMSRRNMEVLCGWLKILLPIVALAGLVFVAMSLNGQPVSTGSQGTDTEIQQTQSTTLPAEETVQTTAPTEDQTTDPTDETEENAEAATESTEPQEERKLVVIDAGHQSKGNSQKEPIGPGADTMKAKVAGGTRGVATGLAEYKLNLMVAKKLQAVLETRGYQVVMIRTENDVNISNAERAQIANELKADAFIRIHANGSEDSTANGILTICQTKNNPYNKEWHDESYSLSQKVLSEMVKATGAKKLYVWETDTMSGINWCQVPVTIVEMGFMTNAEEDRKLSDDAYQDKLTTGIANGIDSYFAE